MSTPKRFLVASALIGGAILVAWSLVGPRVVVTRTMPKGGATAECRAFGLPGLWMDSVETYGASSGDEATARRLRADAIESCRLRARAVSAVGIVLFSAGVAGAFVSKQQDRRARSATAAR